jgi:hypothetical protein
MRRTVRPVPRAGAAHLCAKWVHAQLAVLVRKVYLQRKPPDAPTLVCHLTIRSFWYFWCYSNFLGQKANCKLQNEYKL